MGKRQITKRRNLFHTLHVVVVLSLIAVSGCEVEPEAQPEGVVSVKETIATDQGACQIVLAVENTGDVVIEQSNIVVSIATETRQYYQRVVDTSVIAPNETIGLVEEIILDSPDETVDVDATTVQWESFS